MKTFKIFLFEDEKQRNAAAAQLKDLKEQLKQANLELTAKRKELVEKQKILNQTRQQLRVNTYSKLQSTPQIPVNKGKEDVATLDAEIKSLKVTINTELPKQIKDIQAQIKELQNSMTNIGKNFK